MDLRKVHFQDKEDIKKVQIKMIFYSNIDNFKVFNAFNIDSFYGYFYLKITGGKGKL